MTSLTWRQPRLWELIFLDAPKVFVKKSLKPMKLLRFLRVEVIEPPPFGCTK